jgi:hypothetical protein
MKTATNGHPWIAKAHFDTVLERCRVAEECVRRLLNTINPALLEQHAFDYVAATNEVCDE